MRGLRQWPMRQDSAGLGQQCLALIRVKLFSLHAYTRARSLHLSGYPRGIPYWPGSSATCALRHNDNLYVRHHQEDLVCTGQDPRPGSDSA